MSYIVFHPELISWPTIILFCPSKGKQEKETQMSWLLLTRAGPEGEQFLMGHMSILVSTIKEFKCKVNDMLPTIQVH
jgi:hypothetical protein